MHLSTRALVAASSPLNVEPTLLQPLTYTDDVLEVLRTRAEPDGRALLDCLGVAPDYLAEHVAEQAVALTGGVGRALQYLLRAQQWSALHQPTTITSAAELDAAFEGLHPYLASLPGNMLRVQWDGPEAVTSEELPKGVLRTVLRQGEQQHLLQLLARILLLNAPFPAGMTVLVGGHNVPLSDLALMFGLPYRPAAAAPAAPAAPAAAAQGASISKGASHLQLVAGQWMCRSLPSAVGGDPSAFASSAQLVAALRGFGEGRPFEMIAPICSAAARR